MKNISSLMGERERQLQKKKSEDGKKYRVNLKKARTEEAEERKRWAKTEAFSHDYGLDSDECGADSDEEEAFAGTSTGGDQDLFIQETQ